MVPRKSHNKLLTEILKIPGNVVSSYQLQSTIGIIVKIEPEQQQATCPRCGHSSQRLHQNHWHLIKDLPLSTQPVYLRVNRRQFKCEHCKKPFSELLDYVNPKRNYTKRLAHEIVGQVLDSDLRSVADKNDVSVEEIQTMLKDAGAEYLQEKPRSIKRLGIDEIALVKGQGNYCAILVDLDSRKPIAILNSRKQSELRKVFQSWGSGVLHQIKEVSIDLWKPYKSLVEELMPLAQLVADRFHVMKLVNEELDAQRKKFKAQAQAENNPKEKARILAALKGSKYALLKNEKELNESQKLQLESIQTIIPPLAKMHQYKEELRDIFETAIDGNDGLWKLIDWLKVTATDFPQSRSTIIKWFGEIMGYFEQRTTNGVVEGINHKLKLIKRAAYGFRNFGNFRLRSLLSWYFPANLAYQVL